ncbi:MAG: glycoside hydrolase family 3 protein, partial [Ardenticatenaceae bacterium]
YAPVCDVNSNPQNPVIGTRSFGEEPELVARLAAATVEGMQAAGVAATAKHFPGHGDTATDSHHDVPRLSVGEERLRRVEWPPFDAAIVAGVWLVMTAHVALPDLTGGSHLPATLVPGLLQGVLRQQMGFDGVVISDAMAMGAITRASGAMGGTLAAALAGLDLLLLDGPQSVQDEFRATLETAISQGILAEATLQQSLARIAALKAWVGAQAQPNLDVVGCTSHRALAQQVADAAVTLVRDEAGLLPLRLPPDARVVVITPQPADLTPADTSSTVVCTLGEAVRRYHPRAEEITVAHAPGNEEIAHLQGRAREADLLIVGTLNAFAQPAQAALVRALLATGVPVIGVAMRMPYDLQLFPALPTYLCSYSILEPSMEAVARVLWGIIPARGRLPVSIPGLYSAGMTRDA